MEDPNVIRTETRLRLPIFGQLPDVGHRKLAMCLNLGECQIANALIEHGTQSTWPNSRHLGQVVSVAPWKRGLRQLRPSGSSDLELAEMPGGLNRSTFLEVWSPPLAGPAT